MRITIADRLRALFARNKYEFWFQHISDEEKQLSRMDVWELAKEISQNGSDSPEGIVAEHMLNARLAKMQVRATYVGIFFGLFGVVIGVILSRILG